MPRAQRWHYVRPWLYAKQAAFIFAAARYAVIEASTKTGKTVAALVWLFEQAIKPNVEQEGRNYWWVAPTRGVAQIAYRRLKRFLPRAIYDANESELRLDLINGASIWFKGSDRPDLLYGEDVYAAVIDEASRCKEESWHAVRSTLTATRGPIRIIGNVRGRKNWAYHLARKAQAGAPDMAYFKLTAWDAVEGGVLAREEVEDAERVLPRDVFRELYLAEPTDDGGNPFGMAAIAACVAPLSAEPVSVWGWDLAKSQDWTFGVGLDAEGRTSTLDRWQGPWETTIDKIAGYVGETPALVDSTGVGDPVLEQLQKRGSAYEGFKFTAPSKQQLMEGLAVALQRREVTIPDEDHPLGAILRAELESFEYAYTRTGVKYSAPEGLHDDGVCGLALAVWHRRQAREVGDYGITL